MISASKENVLKKLKRTIRFIMSWRAKSAIDILYTLGKLMIEIKKNTSETRCKKK
jgi:hypothetical protein